MAASLNEDDACITRVADEFRTWQERFGTMSVTGVSVDASAVHVAVKRSYKDVVFNKSKSTSCWVSIPSGDGAAVPPPSLSIPMDAPILSSLSSTGEVLSSLRREEKRGEERGRFVFEFWHVSTGELIKTVYIDGSVHGDVINDGWFSSELVWSGDDRYLCYVAEAKPAVTGDALFDIPTKKANNSTLSSTAGSTTSSSEVEAKKEDCLRTRVYDYDLPGGHSGNVRESWGEKYENVRSPVLICLDIATGKHMQLPGLPPQRTTDGQVEKGAEGRAVSCGQPSWLTHRRGDGSVAQFLVYTAWDTSKRRLGMIYCYNRFCDVVVCDVTKWLAAFNEKENKETVSHVVVSSGFNIARGARWIHTPESLTTTASSGAPHTTEATEVGTVAFLTMAGSGELTHNAASSVQLVALSLKDGAVAPIASYCLAGVVASPQDAPGSTGLLTGPDGSPTRHVFPSIYSHMIPPRQLASSDDGCFYMTTLIRSQHRVVAIKTSSRAEAGENVSVLPPLDDGESCALLWITTTPNGETCLICTSSSPTRPDRLFALIRTTSGKWDVRALQAGETSNAARARLGINDCASKLANLEWRYIASGVPELDTFGDAFAVWPKSAGRLPLVVVPHGGPHSTLPAEFLSPYAFLATKGFCVLLVNYRGSLGYGESGTASLPGKAGFQDADDVYQFTLATLKELDSVIDRDKVGIMGGSHGGFLTGHAVGQHPELYKVGVMRNPVTNIATMMSATDIPDWCFVEGLGLNGLARPGDIPAVTGEDLMRMFSASPMCHISKVSAPVLFTVGMKDRRVPPFQAIEMYNALKSRGIVTRLLAYPEDVHAIDKPVAEADAWVNMTLWLAQYLGVTL